MLRKFRVSNFKCFEIDFEIDFSKINGYEFNDSCIKNDTVNTAIIYGHNGVGKSNLAFAIFDIIEHLTDKKRDPGAYKNYLCATGGTNYASFYYEFLIDKNTIVYEYRKTDYETIIYERLTINNKEVVVFDRSNENILADILLDGTANLNKSITNKQLSVLKYIKNNSELADNNTNKAFNSIFEFVESMLFFRSLEKRTFLGFMNDPKVILDGIIEKDKVQDFENFLNEADINCKLEVVDELNGKTIYMRLGDKLLKYYDVISTGTSSLTLFYYWYIWMLENKISFVFIDEFDAFYHHKLSSMIVGKLKELDVQCVLTSHNISNLTNELLRPDCYFLMNKKAAKSLSNCTQKELREAHNIEKLYKANTFHV